jgi:hypothetical protein
VPAEVPARLTRRVLLFHQAITGFRRTDNIDLSVYARICPPIACINSAHRRRTVEKEKGIYE